MSLDNIPRLRLGHLPTPLDEAPRLAEQLGLQRLLVKRDDETGLGLGGNKVRKLEYLMAEALNQKCDIVLTVGGPQSNHARLTAAAAKHAGLDALLVLGGPRFERFDGNLLLDIIFDAEIRYIPDAGVAKIEESMAEAAEELRKAGRKPFIVPFGGSTPYGALGYTSAMRELAKQLGDERAPQIVTAVGSGGTLAGLILGKKLFMPDARLIGISVGRFYEPFMEICTGVANGAAELIGESTDCEPCSAELYQEYVGECYGVPSDAGNKAILLAGRTEGLVLDPVYTGKTMAGLIDLVNKDIVDRDKTVVFMHTGGSPALFAHEQYFRKLARYSEEK